MVIAASIMALPETSQLQELATAPTTLRRKSSTEAAKSEQLPSAWVFLMAFSRRQIEKRYAAKERKKNLFARRPQNCSIELVE